MLQKKIVDGVNFNNIKPMVVKLFQTSIFSCNLIHGPGFNLSKNNRISIDFKINQIVIHIHLLQHPQKTWPATMVIY